MGQDKALHHLFIGCYLTLKATSEAVIHHRETHVRIVSETESNCTEVSLDGCTKSVARRFRIPFDAHVRWHARAAIRHVLTLLSLLSLASASIHDAYVTASGRPIDVYGAVSSAQCAVFAAGEIIARARKDNVLWAAFPSFLVGISVLCESTFAPMLESLALVLLATTLLGGGVTLLAQSQLHSTARLLTSGAGHWSIVMAVLLYVENPASVWLGSIGFNDALRWINFSFVITLGLTYAGFAAIFCLIPPEKTALA
ncbi:unnamed protein product [Notodromas monacha]|uniref:Uncharacterized protein n=1 Tax=Notodromas monacha TaxID=399045 RepID=A0A7R9BSV1_9CRUS|nr:unnamed protein product [Notodromas monacha]CAG0920053.1 unnamed protein product [Notodromas monacha]